MKIEMCESLIYSWLRHVKGCQIVQSNWKPSPTWTIENMDKAEKLMQSTDTYFQEKYGYEIYKSNSFSQLISQAESDLVGICTDKENTCVYSVEAAFHEGGLNYGGTEETITRIIKKLVRSALCIAGYFNIMQGEIIFASPKINNAVINDLNGRTEELNRLFSENGFGFTARIIANEGFKNEVLEPVMEVSGRVNDTTELFMRSWQLFSMFGQPNTEKLSRSGLSEINIPSEEDKIKKVGSDCKINSVENSYLLLDLFRRYLSENGYKDNTVDKYVPYVQRVAKEWEHIDVVTLAREIDEILPKYDKEGIYQDRGQIGNAGVINALRRFSEFISNFIEMLISQKGEQ